MAHQATRVSLWAQPILAAGHNLLLGRGRWLKPVIACARFSEPKFKNSRIFRLQRDERRVERPSAGDFRGPNKTGGIGGFFESFLGPIFFPF